MYVKNGTVQLASVGLATLCVSDHALLNFADFKYWVKNSFRHLQIQSLSMQI